MHTRHHAAVLIALALPLACSDGDNQAQDFCEQLASVQDELAAINQTEPDRLADTVDTLEDIDPPDEIATSYNNVVDVYRTIADGGTLTDPANANKFADVQDDITAITQYTADTCEGPRRTNPSARRPSIAQEARAPRRR